MSTQQALYRFWDEAGSLLYIGISLNPFARMGQHRADKQWWSDVVNVTIEAFATREEVEAAERAAIKVESPRYNVTHVPKEKRPPKPDPFHSILWPAPPTWFLAECSWCGIHQSPKMLVDCGDRWSVGYECLKKCGNWWDKMFDKDLVASRASAIGWAADGVQVRRR